MDRVTLQNYRCFREKQSARLAPLTFLVGENSTGKTSFLALLRALWQVAFQDRIPDFRQPPYDLGAFEDVLHYRGANNKRLDSFEVGFRYSASPINGAEMNYRVEFEARDGYPFPLTRCIRMGEEWVELSARKTEGSTVRVGNPHSKYECSIKTTEYPIDDKRLLPIRFMLGEVSHVIHKEKQAVSADGFHRDGKSSIDRQVRQMGATIEKSLVLLGSQEGVWETPRSPFASAPIRFHPKRTYDPSRPTQDPEGEYIPDYLASMSRNTPSEWEHLKSELENFGRDSSLFDEIDIRSFGNTVGSPFQIQIRKYSESKRLKGPKRNLIDVGYGVSQALPILIELLREDSPKMFLLQQPEVHLHPRAQAALGSLFCNLAASGKQIIVETHSDYILDRARMDIRDGKTDLKPDDISILYFERDELDVNIHSLRTDEDGNVLDAPPGYGQFFMDEMRRSVGL